MIRIIYTQSFKIGESSPATLQAAKAVDFFVCLLGHVIEIADAEQAYIQAEMKGDPTWVCLPPEAQPAWWRKVFPHVCRPFVVYSRRCTDILTLVLTGNRNVARTSKQWDSFPLDQNGCQVITVQACC